MLNIEIISYDYTINVFSLILREFLSIILFRERREFIKCPYKTFSFAFIYIIC